MDAMEAIEELRRAWIDSHRKQLDILTVKQAAEALGLAPATVRAWILQRRLGYHKIGGAVRIPINEIRRVLKESFVPAQNAKR
jgi:excisionase family DNA binding protein